MQHVCAHPHWRMCSMVSWLSCRRLYHYSCCYWQCQAVRAFALGQQPYNLAVAHIENHTPPHAAQQQAHKYPCCCTACASLPQTPTDKEWFQGTADAVRQYAWLLTDTKNRGIEDVVILSGDHL